jgi:hypothetical protein
MRQFRSARIIALMVVLSVAPLVACSRGGDAASPTVGTAGTTTGTRAPDRAPVITAASVACNQAVLTPVVQAKYAGAALAEVVCSPPYAMATVNGGFALSGAGVAILRFVNGAWLLQASGPADEADVLAPGDFSKSVLSSWQSQYKVATAPPTQATAKRPATSAPASTTTLGPSNADCRQNGDQYNCTATTTTVPPTTTTTAPPPPPPPPTNPTSAYCAANPFDANCIADTNFPG